MLNIETYQKIAEDVARNTASYAGPKVPETHPSYTGSREHHAGHLVALAENQNALEERIAALEAELKKHSL
jgi:hypothetical protein